VGIFFETHRAGFDLTIAIICIIIKILFHVLRGVVKNRHIELQLKTALREIEKQKALGWFCLDIISDSDNVDLSKIQNAVLKLSFAKLNGNGVTKTIVILKDATIVILGEY
jgi:hypothetical protein